ncbi:hypothetical protein ACN28S_07990 [Cystobacter fuscus]
MPTMGVSAVARTVAASVLGETVGQIPLMGWLIKGAASGGTAFAVGITAVNYFEKKYSKREATPFETASLKDWMKAAP